LDTRERHLRVARAHNGGYAVGKPIAEFEGLKLKTIGKYEITAEIGRGAMGEVYKARDPSIGRMVALKVITSGLTGKPELLERFYQEARSAGALQHPNIVTVYELGKEGDLPFIAMEFLGGDSLEKLIARQAPLPLVQKVGYVIQICRALEYAHKHGVVHRDIKPGNIMTTSEGAIKVVDFGIARLVDASKTQTGTLIGTLGYMSPQQLRGEHADERSDIWAVGVLFYELLIYKRPFQGDNPAALMMTIISQEPPPLADSGAEYTSEVEAIVFRMLQKEALNRYQTMEEVLFDLDPVFKRLQQARVGELVEQSQRLIEAEDLKTAQQLLREALHADSSHAEAKTLLERVSRELRRQQVLPRVKDQVAKAQGMLASGQLQQAKAEVQAALQLDSTFQPARDLLGEVQKAVERARELDQKLQITKQRLAEGSLTEADSQLDDVLSLDPQNAQAQELRRQIREEVGRRQQRKRLSDAVRHARDLWSQLRYGECISQLVELQKEFPDNAEIAKLLETARRDQAEGEKQKQLAEVRNLLASQQYERARGALNSLRNNFPNDTAVENLLALAQDEEAAAKVQQRRQQELLRLRALAGEGKHAEALASGESLLAEFPDDFELTELVNFASAEVRRAEQARRLEETIGRVRELMAKGSFAEAGRTAEKALREFPGNAELKTLGEEANRNQQEKQRREQMELRIREVKSRLERDELTGAIELAKETIATLGPDTNVTRLLQAAQSERQERMRKKEQERRVQDARSLLDAGKLDEATQIVNEALATQLLDAADPRVKTIQIEVERKKKVDAAQTLLGAGKLDEATQIVNEALATQLLDAADPRVKTFLAEVESQRQKASVVSQPAPAAPTPRPEADPSILFSATGISTPAEPQPTPSAPAPAKVRELAAERPAGKNKKTPMVIAATIAIAAVIGGGIYLATSRGKAASALSPAQTPASASNPSTSTPTPAASQPAPNPLEQQQQQLMDQAQALAGQGQFTQALQDLDNAIKLNGPLEQNVQTLRAQIAKAESDSEAQAAMQKEGQLWNQAVAAYQQDQLDAAARDFQQVAAMKTGLHQADTRKYLDTLIPQARRSDVLFRRAQSLAKNVNNRLSLEQANQDLQQVVIAGGPRAAQASRLQAAVKSLLNASDELQQLVKEYNSGTDSTSQLEKLQQEIRGLENVNGGVGQKARLLDQRISADLKDLHSTAPLPPPMTNTHASTASASTSRLVWLVSIDSSSASGEQIEDHPLPYALVAKAAANHARFKLQLSINSQGRVTAGRVLSGVASLGQSLVSEAEKGWRFSPPGQNNASAQVSVQF
jgi:serine/threonine protein kinase